ncbi:MAG: sulfatase-like hydrolase/transferase [Lachnospiraceae bacterium]|uniref:sulfatase n=1 Tax=uncultured Acetatifactor sp. TaxID=1671927 RepID=UPI00261B4B5D|nr:sulfatase [uncultured Acetatifactor sp.]MCI8788064.1 sulfatase-like hydrolase/transferase [Lachnospiraceae bacterium]
MRVLMFDIDTLRADHMGCYGYGRDTTPVMDQIAEEGVRFDNYYCPNAPCLPSRASMISGLYGIHNGVVGHGGTAADMRLQGTTRHFTDDMSENSLFMQFRRAGMHTVSFSTFAERHGAWWFNAGFNECHNVGYRGGESAELVTPRVLEWLEKNGNKDNWMMHVHYWDPHTPYRTPVDYKAPFEGEPLPDDWITEDIFAEHLRHIGPHGANEINMWNDMHYDSCPKHPGRLNNLAEAKEFLHQYDNGIRYTDDHIGMIISWLKENGLYDDDLAIIITADHGEDIGEFGVYAEHGMADEPVCRIPLIVRWPGMRRGEVVKGFYDNTDLAPTVQELLGTGMFAPDRYRYDGVSFAAALRDGTDCSKPYVVLTQCAHVCQRSARFDDYVYIRTVHGGYHLLPEEMLFNVVEDPHEQHNLAKEHPELCAKGAKMILDWNDAMMKTSRYDVDPMWTVMREGGPEHCRGALQAYMKRLEGTDREYGIELLKEQYGDEP